MMSSKQNTILLAALTTLICVAASSVHACGATSECRVGKRYYLIRMPEGHDGKTLIGAIVFAHGYGGTAQQIMRHKGLAKLANRLGVALIAPKSAGRDWTLPGAPLHSTVSGVDELAYFDRVIDNASYRFPIDKTKLMASGFSAGGMMVWNLACHRSHKFAGFAPIAGTFWEPVPKRCTTPPTHIIHMHGTSDRIVPIEGRRIANTRQGSVTRALKMYANYAKFGPVTTIKAGNLTCMRRISQAKRLLEFCTFPGGHRFDTRGIARAWRLTVMKEQN